MSTLIPFTFETTAVRVIDRDGATWFVLADVCRVLEMGNPRNVTARLDDDEKGVHSMDTPGGDQTMTIINESGLWSLVLTSRKPAAKRFKKWVTAEVLPSIRKTGRYAAPGAEEQPARPLDLDTAERWMAVIGTVNDLAGPDAARSVLERSQLLAGVATTGPRREEPAPTTAHASVTAFLAARTERGQGFRVASRALHDAYAGWCGERGAAPLTRNTFGRLMTAAGFATIKASVNFYTGLRLLPAVRGGTGCITL